MMRLDRVTAEIRPRSDWESVDLGLAMVRRDFWRCLTLWWLALSVPVVAAGWVLWDRPLVLLIFFWWCKPAGSRMVLWQLSRRLFGEQPAWRAVWRELPRVWWRRFFYRFVWARFSPWLPVTLPVGELEGLRGKAYQQRVGQMARRGNGAVIWTYFIADVAAVWFGLAIFGLVAMFIPEGQDAPWTRAVEEWDAATPFEIPLLLLRTISVCSMVAMSLADVFLTGAGFGLYVNTRTWIEGWDVELAFRRLGQRLEKVTGVLLLMLCWGMPLAMGAEAAAEVERTPHAVIEQVKSQQEFVVHKVKRQVTKDAGYSPGWLGSAFAGLLGWVMVVTAVVLVGGFIGWLIWKYRHGWLLRGGGAKPARAVSARVVLGMLVTPESLPRDIPGMAWSLWQQGRQHEALGLLYRGTISRVIECGRVEIFEADTEGDCLRRVECAGPPAYPDYFRRLTGVWISLAYAGRPPVTAAVEGLCRDWPFVERGPA